MGAQGHTEQGFYFLSTAMNMQAQSICFKKNIPHADLSSKHAEGCCHEARRMQLNFRHALRKHVHDVISCGKHGAGEWRVVRVSHNV
jgi:hypothetical protein